MFFSITIACAPAGYVASYWHLPMVTAYCTDPSLDNRTTYDTMIRILGSTSGFGSVFSQIFKAFNWHLAVVVSDTASDVCQYGVTSIVAKFKNNNISVSEWIQLTADPSDMELEICLEKIRQRARSKWCATYGINNIDCRCCYFSC